MEEQNAFWMLNYLIEVILPPKFFSNGNEDGVPFIGFQQEQFILINLATTKLKIISQSEIRKIRDFIDITATPMLLSLFVDSLSLEATYVAWKELFTAKSVKIFFYFIYLFPYLVFCYREDLYRCY